MGADATLVAAAYRMGMANVPGDYSASFNKQYEGIIAADRARAELFGTAIKEITGIMGGIVERKLKRDKDLEDAFESVSAFSNIDLDQLSELYPIFDQIKNGWLVLISHNNGAS